MNLLDMLLGHKSQTIEQPINFIPGNAPPQQNNNWNEAPIRNQHIPEKTGLLQELINGYRDNRYNKFDPENLNPVKNKSTANKIGEGFGSLVRFSDSPLGRFAETAGLVGATGGSGLQALGYGATAGLTNQKVKTEDSLYRDQLKQDGIDTSNISGYLNSTDYNNITNAKYKNAYQEYLLDRSEGTKNSKTMTIGELMNVSPEYKKYIMSQYDFSNGQNEELLQQELPVDMLKNTGWLPKEVNVNTHASGTTTKNIVKSGNSTSTINYTGGTHSTKDNYGSKNPRPITKIMTDAQGHKAEVEVDKNGKAIRVIKEL